MYLSVVLDTWSLIAFAVSAKQIDFTYKVHYLIRIEALWKNSKGKVFNTGLMFTKLTN